MGETMATILEMKRRFEKLNPELVIYQVMKDSETDLNDLNLEQIYSGKTNTGADIRPSYLEDPYWDDKGGLPAAQRYSEYKDRITPSSRRNPGTPNLFINGYYHSRRITTVVPGGEILHTDSAGFGKEIQQKYKNIDGLGGEFKEIFIKDYIRPLLNQQLELETGLLMNK